MRIFPVLSALAVLALAPAGLAGGAAAQQAQVTGTATYLDRALLPPDATVEVVLEDISRADAPAVELARQTLAPRSGPPYPFALSYDRSAIDDRHTYAVRARVTHGGRLVMTSDTVVPVLTRGAPDTGVEVLMRRVSAEAAADAGPAAEQVFTAPGLRLPASFTGTLPMASGPGADWHLDLWPDQVFHLATRFGDGRAAADIGRWSADPSRGAIVLRGGREAPLYLEVRGDGSLRLMDPQGAPIESDLPYTLAAGPLDPAEVALPMQGMFRYMADAALFQECRTGRSYPVAMEQAYIEVERAYLALEGRAPGAPVLAVLEGRLAERPAMEGPPRTHLVIERFSRLVPGRDCAGATADAELTNTYWRILRIGGAAVGTEEGRREPHLVLRAGETPAFNATVGCNMMRGGYTLEGEALTLGDAAMTMMACPPPLDTRERALAEALAEVAAWAVNGTTLELFDAAGTRRLLAEAVYLP